METETCLETVRRLLLLDSVVVIFSNNMFQFVRMKPKPKVKPCNEVRNWKFEHLWESDVFQQQLEL